MSKSLCLLLWLIGFYFIREQNYDYFLKPQSFLLENDENERRKRIRVRIRVGPEGGRKGAMDFVLDESCFKMKMKRIYSK